MNVKLVWSKAVQNLGLEKFGKCVTARMRNFA